MVNTLKNKNIIFSQNNKHVCQSNKDKFQLFMNKYIVSIIGTDASIIYIIIVYFLCNNWNVYT